MPQSSLRTCLLVVACIFSFLLCGCSAVSSSTQVGSEPVRTTVALTGKAFGGQQPIVGASIQLYAASTSGYSATSTPLLTLPVLTLAGGAFTITGDYTCPSAETQVYLTATGGNPGLAEGIVNPEIALIAALGPCGNLSASTSVIINEATTVAAVWAFAPFMADLTHVGTSATNVLGLQNAFVSAAQLADVSTGQVPGILPDSNVIAPIKRTNTIADILASCVNSAGGASGDGTACGKLMLYATPSGGVAPTNTVGAALDIAKEPGHNASSLAALASATAPFQPTDSATIYDLSLGITIVGGNGRFVAFTDLAVDAEGNVWLPSYYSSYTVTNGTGNFSGSGFIAEVGSNGSLVSSAGGYTDASLQHPESLAVDSGGNIWINNASLIPADNASIPGLVEITSEGSVLSGSTGFSQCVANPNFVGGIACTLFEGGAVTFDPVGDLWVTAGAGNGSATAKYRPGFGFLSRGPSSTYDQPYGYCEGASCQSNSGNLAVDGTGDAWMAASSEGTPIELSPSGAYLSPSAGYSGGGYTSVSGGGALRHIAIDADNNAWYADQAGTNGFSPSGRSLSSAPFTANDGNGPTGIAIDGSNTIWIAVATGGSGGLTHYSTAGGAISSAPYGYSIPTSETPSESGLNSEGASPNVLALDASGNIWTLSGDFYLTKMIGLAAPVVTPASVAIAGDQLGARP